MSALYLRLSSSPFPHPEACPLPQFFLPRREPKDSPVSCAHGAREQSVSCPNDHKAIFLCHQPNFCLPCSAFGNASVRKRTIGNALGKGIGQQDHSTPASQQGCQESGQTEISVVGIVEALGLWNLQTGSLSRKRLLQRRQASVRVLLEHRNSQRNPGRRQPSRWPWARTALCVPVSASSQHSLTSHDRYRML